MFAQVGHQVDFEVVEGWVCGCLVEGALGVGEGGVVVSGALKNGDRTLGEGGVVWIESEGGERVVGGAVAVHVEGEGGGDEVVDARVVGRGFDEGVCGGDGVGVVACLEGSGETWEGLGDGGMVFVGGFGVGHALRG